MTWRRLGHIYRPRGSNSWARSHASLPFPVQLEGDTHRVFFSARDTENRSSVGWVDIRLRQSFDILREAEEPVLSFGAAGDFDDSGIGLGSIVRASERDLMYYMGWNLGVLAPWRNSIGLAVGDSSIPNFQRLYQGPIMDRSPIDPYTLSYPWVMHLAADDWRMWYGSNLAWGASSADMQHVIKAARSKDGVNWVRDSEPAVGLSFPGEYALARPCVLRGRSGFHMWFATRGERYRIGAAHSRDGDAWYRCDLQAGLQPEEATWDGEMVCYPCVFRHKETVYMLYNGNSYGREGFGLAFWDGAPL